MQITNLDLNTAAGHKILHAMDNMKVRIIAKNGIAAIGVLSVPAQRHPHVTLSVSETKWEPIHIPRQEIDTIEYIAEER